MKTHCKLLGLTCSLALCCCAATNSSQFVSSSTKAPTSLMTPSVYETNDLSPWSDQARIDFTGLNETLKSVHFVFSPVNATSDQRLRSESGGEAMLWVSPDGYLVDHFNLYVPKPSVTRWQDQKFSCLSNADTGQSLTVSCTSRLTNKMYRYGYSTRRGIEWFETYCSGAKGNICRYELRTSIGLLTYSMIAQLANLDYFKTR